MTDAHQAFTHRAFMESPPQGGADQQTAEARGYRVLARKYRPATFADLIGQEAMVRTLSNAFRMGRIAHAFMLVGVRGVGKTTTARLLARALNYAPQGAGGKTGADPGPTLDMPGLGLHCGAIMESRHMDVMEMDAASRTGIDDIRELVENSRYRPVSARYKVYIVDEVHMLSTAAFNGLLKTLEEPPGHVKFIFATTEVRKIPVTVLSRCQRFDLRRLDTGDMHTLLSRVAEREEVSVTPDALELLVRAADGSARDGLSLLDQAIAHGGSAVEEEPVRDMLGLADRERVLDLFDALMRGDATGALREFQEQYRAGADPVAVVSDLCDLTHWLTLLKLAGPGADAMTVSQSKRVRATKMAQELGMRALMRTWQMLLKGLEEVRTAPRPADAAEMMMVRLAYAADLPTPGELIRKLQGHPALTAPAAVAAPAAPAAAVAPATPAAPAAAVAPPPAPSHTQTPSLEDEARQTPLVQAALAAFPGARIKVGGEVANASARGRQ